MKPYLSFPAIILTLGIHHLAAQGTVFTDGEPLDSDWSSALNWNPAQPTATDDAFIFDGLAADITVAGALAQVIHVGDGRDAGATTGVGTLNMTGGDLTALNIHLGSGIEAATNPIGVVDGTLNFVDGTINLVPVDQSLGNGIEIGSATVGVDGITSVTGAMTMGDGTTNPTLNYTEAHLEIGWGAGSNASFDFKSGTITGTDTGFDPNVVLGQMIGSTGSYSMTVGTEPASPTPAVLTTDWNFNHNGGNATLTINGNGSVTCNNNLALSNDPASTTSLVVINLGGSLTVGNNLNDQDGPSSMTIDGGTLNLLSENATSRGVEELTLGGSGTGSTISLPVGSLPLSVLIGTATTVETTGTHTIEAASLASGIANADIFSTTWTGGDAAWANGDSLKWSGYAGPDGVAGVGENIPVIKSAATITGADTATFAVGGAAEPNFSGVNVMSDLVAEDTLALTVGTAFDIGALRAVIDTASAVTRTGDLRVARDAGADAQQLDISDGSLTFTGLTDELVIGGVQNNDAGPVFVSGVVNNGSNVTITGGTMTVPSIRFFGTTPLPLADPNDVPMGGILNVNGGTLTVTGNIIEGPGTGDASVDEARIDVDGGTLDVTGDITVESFRVANEADTTGSFTLKSGQTLTQSEGVGNFYISNNDGADGTFIAESGSTINILSSGLDDFILANARAVPGTGRFISNGATINTACRVRVADGGTGIMTLNGDTLWTSDGNEFRVGDGDNPAEEPNTTYGGDGTLTLNGNATIIHRQNNFEMADLGNATNVIRPVKGTLVMNDNSSITVTEFQADGTTANANPNFYLGRQGNHEVSVTLTGSPTLDVHGQIWTDNDAKSIFNASGGEITASRWRCSDATGGSCEVNLSGDVIVTIDGATQLADFDFMDNGVDKLTLSEQATMSVERRVRLNRAASLGEQNELKIIGGEVDLNMLQDFLCDLNTKVTFVPDADFGISTIVVGRDCNLGVGLAATTLIFDDAALTSANTIGEMTMIDVSRNVIGSFAGLPEGATVGGPYPDDTEFRISYAGGDGNDIILYAYTPPADSYLAWTTDYPTLTGGFDADDDGDGVPNGHEWYFYDTDPTVAQSHGSPLGETTPTGAGSFTFSHLRPVDRTGTTEDYEWSTTLEDPWIANGASDGAHTVTLTPGTPVPDVAGYEKVTVTTSSVPDTLAEVFARLRLTNP